MAHNCVTIDGKNSSRVWGGFRVGKRAKVSILIDENNEICAEHFGYGHRLCRHFGIDKKSIIITDEYDGDEVAISFIHLAPSVSINEITNQQVFTSCGIISISNAISVTKSVGKVSSSYNHFEESSIVKISFRKKMTYIIHS